MKKIIFKLFIVLMFQLSFVHSMEMGFAELYKKTRTDKELLKKVLLKKIEQFLAYYGWSYKPGS